MKPVLFRSVVCWLRSMALALFIHRPRGESRCKDSYRNKNELKEFIILVNLATLTPHWKQVVGTPNPTMLSNAICRHQTLRWEIWLSSWMVIFIVLFIWQSTTPHKSLHVVWEWCCLPRVLALVCFCHLLANSSKWFGMECETLHNCGTTFTWRTLMD